MYFSFLYHCYHKNYSPLHFSFDKYIVWWFTEYKAYIYPTLVESTKSILKQEIPWFDYKIWPTDAFLIADKSKDVALTALKMFNENMSITHRYSEFCYDLTFYIFIFAVIWITIRTFYSYLKYFEKRQYIFKRFFNWWYRFVEAEFGPKFREQKDFIQLIGLTQFELWVLTTAFWIGALGPLYFWRKHMIIWPLGEQTGIELYTEFVGFEKRINDLKNSKIKRLLIWLFNIKNWTNNDKTDNIWIPTGSFPSSYVPMYKYFEDLRTDSTKKRIKQVFNIARKKKN